MKTTIDAEVTRVTDRAILVTYDGEDRWIPRSVCDDGDEIDVGDSDITVQNWWLRKEGLL